MCIEDLFYNGTPLTHWCIISEFEKATAQRERWEAHHNRRKRDTSPHHRSKRSFSTERYVETLVVVDPSMIKYHKNEHLETYVLTIMNMVSASFVVYVCVSVGSHPRCMEHGESWKIQTRVNKHLLLLLHLLHLLDFHLV